MPGDELINLEENMVPTLWDHISPWLQLSYGTPLTALIGYLFYILWPRKNTLFGNTYYFLVRVDLITSWFVYLNTWLGNRIRNISFLLAFLKWIEISFPGFLTASRFLFNVFLLMQFFTSIILSVYHLDTVIRWNHREKNTWLWKFYYCPCAILCGIYYCVLLFTWGYTSETFILNETLYTLNHKDTIHTYIQISAFASTCFFLIYAVVWTTYRIKRNSIIHASKSPGAKKIRQNMAVSAFANTLSFFPIILWSIVCLCFEDKLDGKLRLDLLMFASDIKTFATALTLLAADVNVKNHIKPKKPLTTYNSPLFTVSNVARMT